jgi:3-hydroxyisobutyrate dehydrogenase-like beta-hydroxyacid dehydrogenase
MKLSVIGIGNMGRAVASALLAAGHEVAVYNRTRARAEALASRGARVMSTAAEAIRASDYTIVILLDVGSTRAVLGAPDTRAVLRGKALISGAQMEATEISDLSREVADAGGRLSDLVILTYPDSVEARTSSYCIAADQADSSAWREVFASIGKNVWDVGAVGNAQKVQNAAWLSYMFMTIAIGSVLAGFKLQGLPLPVLKWMLTEGPTTAIAGADDIIPEMDSRKYGSDKWTVNNMITTLDQINTFAANLGIDISVMNGVRELYAKAAKLGFGGQNVTALYEAIVARA